MGLKVLKDMNAIHELSLSELSTEIMVGKDLKEMYYFSQIYSRQN